MCLEAQVSVSEYGAEFDERASTWAVLETEHDKMHPDRSQCGGVGGCSMMAAAHDVEVEIMDALEEWRDQFIARRK